MLNGRWREAQPFFILTVDVSRACWSRTLRHHTLQCGCGRLPEILEGEGRSVIEQHGWKVTASSGARPRTGIDAVKEELRYI